jgi:hypothetical protein
MIFTFGVCGPAAAQHQHGAAASATSACMSTGFGTVHHPVKTSNPEAQRAFEHGMALDYGFNHNQAEKCFQRAAELDPNMAMAYWGIALVLGTNYNLPVDAEREKQAYNAIQKALALSTTGPANERAYIEALAKRYTDKPDPDYEQLEMEYHDSMRTLYKRYPADLDAATLFAESGMNLHPWKLWSRDGAPAPGTEEIVAVLKSVLQRDPHHLGANHFYIHAVEASSHPGAGTRIGTPGTHARAHLYSHRGPRIERKDKCRRGTRGRSLLQDCTSAGHLSDDVLHSQFAFHRSGKCVYGTLCECDRRRKACAGKRRAACEGNVRAGFL